MKIIFKIGNYLANIFFSTAIIFFAFNLVYLLYRGYSLYKTPFPTKSISFNIYYLFCLLGIISFGVALKLRSEIKNNLALIVISVIIPFYLVEAYLSFSPQINKKRIIKKWEKSEKIFDERSQLDVLRELRSQGVNAHLNAPVSVYLKEEMGRFPNEIIPLGNVSGSILVNCNENGNISIINSDKYGFNNPPEAYREVPVDIALIGDSFTFGDCVQTGEDVGSWLRKMGKKVLNFGVSGSGPIIQLGILKEYVQGVSPPIVLWLYFEGNDLEDLIEENRLPVLKKYLNDGYSQNLKDHQKLINSKITNLFEKKIIRKIRRELQKDKGWDLIYNLLTFKRLRTRLLHRSNNKITPQFPEVLAKAEKMVNSWGGRLYFVYLPSFERYAYKKDEAEFLERDKVLSVVKSLGIPIIDFQETLSKENDPLSFFPFSIGPHYSKVGYKLLAEKINLELTRNHPNK